jgi:hypothetical protein
LKCHLITVASKHCLAGFWLDNDAQHKSTMRTIERFWWSGPDQPTERVQRPRHAPAHAMAAGLVGQTVERAGAAHGACSSWGGRCCGSRGCEGPWCTGQDNPGREESRGSAVARQAGVNTRSRLSYLSTSHGSWRCWPSGGRSSFCFSCCSGQLASANSNVPSLAYHRVMADRLRGTPTLSKGLDPPSPDRGR